LKNFPALTIHTQKKGGSPSNKNSMTRLPRGLHSVRSIYKKIGDTVTPLGKAPVGAKKHNTNLKNN